MKIKSLLLSLLLPISAFAVTNTFDNVKINTSIKIVPGAAAGRVLTSDASGFGTWQVGAAGGAAALTNANNFFTSASVNTFNASTLFSNVTFRTQFNASLATNINLSVGSPNILGILPVPNGGTGVSTLGQNLLMFGNGTSPVGSLANGTTNQVLTANGGSLIPTWTTLSVGSGAAALTNANNFFLSSSQNTFNGATIFSNVTFNTQFNASNATNINLAAGAPKIVGILPVPNGGTGVATIGANQLVYGNGASAIATLPDGTTNQVLTANGAGLLPTWKASAGGSGAAAVTNAPNFFTTASTNTFNALTTHQNANVVVTNGQYYGILFNATTNINWNNGNVQRVNLSAGTNNFTLTNPFPGARYLLMLNQPSTNPIASATWPAEVRWPGGAAPVLTTTSNKVDVITFVYGLTNHFGGFNLSY